MKRGRHQTQQRDGSANDQDRYSVSRYAPAVSAHLLLVGSAIAVVARCFAFAVRGAVASPCDEA